MLQREQEEAAQEAGAAVRGGQDALNTTASSSSSSISSSSGESSSDASRSLRRRSSGGGPSQSSPKRGLAHTNTRNNKGKHHAAAGVEVGGGGGSMFSKRRSTAGMPPRLLELKTTYEGPCGSASEKWLHRSTLIVTNRTIEIEREGANCALSVLTLGCWWAVFQTASIEIYELDFVTGLELRPGRGSGHDTIVCLFERPGKGGSSKRKGGGKGAAAGRRQLCRGAQQLVLDLPRGQDYSTADLFYELKESWQVARHGVLDDDDCALSDDDEDDDGDDAGDELDVV
jgi:hypothetical protein